MYTWGFSIQYSPLIVHRNENCSKVDVVRHISNKKCLTNAIQLFFREVSTIVLGVEKADRIKGPFAELPTGIQGFGHVAGIS